MAQAGFAQVKLGNVTVPRDHMIVFVAIGHSNLQSAWASLAPDTNVFVGTDPRIWNFNIADQFNGGPQHTWVPAKEPIHMRNSDLIPCYGPGMPFLKDLLAKLPPDYYLGIIQNAEGRAQLKAHYVDDHTTDYGTNLYSQIHDAIAAVDTTVTWGGVLTMIGLNEHADSTAANNFATNMDTFVVRMRGLTKTPNLPFLITQYEKGATGQYAISSYYGTTIARQIDSIPSFVPFSYVIPTDWTVDTARYLDDSHHFNPVGQIYWAGIASNICDSLGLFSNCHRDTVPPDPPTQIRIDSITCQGALLSWQPSQDNVGVKNYHIVSSQGLDTVVYASPARFPISTDSLSVTFTLRAVDLSSNQSLPVTVSLPYSLSCSFLAPDSLRLVRSTPSSLTVQWHYGPEKGVFLVYIADSLAAIVDSTYCTISNLLPNHSYPVKVVFRDSVGDVSTPSITMTCATIPVPVATVPLSVDFGGTAHGSWVPENIWSETVAHGMLEKLQKDYVAIGPLANGVDTVMSTMLEGEMHYVIRVPRNEYVLTFYLFDPFKHSSARTFTISVDGTTHVDSVISSPGLQSRKTWSALVSFSVATDSLIRFSLTKDSSLLPIASGFTLCAEDPFTISTTADTVAVGDTLRVRWTCNQISVGSANIYMSADSGKSLVLINDKAIGRSDSSWGRFNWIVPALLDQEPVEGVNLMIKVSDYNNSLFGTARCFVRNPTRVKDGTRLVAERIQTLFGKHAIRVKGSFTKGVISIFKPNGVLVNSSILHAPGRVDLSRLPVAMYLVEMKIDGVTYRNKFVVR